MDRAEFVARFGSIFEHSAFIAERAFDAGDADNVYRALVAQFRMASEQERLGVLRAHPDLAGKLAIEHLRQKCEAVFRPEMRKNKELEHSHDSEKNGNALAGGLTVDSQQEQAGAGLDRLSAAEHARFSALNARYVEKFGFPFIIAVKGLDRYDILAAFEVRIDRSHQQEFEAACQQVEKIARLRLESFNFGDIND